jgi:predicted metalloendopeptidase
MHDDAVAKFAFEAAPAPGRYRVNGPLASSPEFAAAFSCKDGDRMVRPTADRCQVW